MRAASTASERFTIFMNPGPRRQNERAREMRTRIAVLSVLVGLALFSTAVVRHVTARDVQRQEPAAPLGDIPATVGLLVAGAGLVTGGAVALARWSRPVVLLSAGAILIGLAGVRFLLADDARRQEQATLDRGWAEESSRAARRFPPVLPGGRPDPAPLRGLPVVIALVAAGVFLCGGGLSAALARRAAARHPQHGGHE